MTARICGPRTRGALWFAINKYSEGDTEIIGDMRRECGSFKALPPGPSSGMTKREEDIVFGKTCCTLVGDRLGVNENLDVIGESAIGAFGFVVRTVSCTNDFETRYSKDQKGIAALFEIVLPRLWRSKDRRTTVSYQTPLP